MTLYTKSGPLPTHKYVWVQPNAIGEHGWMKAIWFGLASYPGRAWGCHLLLECGAVYRNVPLHHIAASQHTVEGWTVSHAQTWNAYGWQFSTIEYPALASLSCNVRVNDKSILPGKYMFTAIPVADSYSAEPEQDKEFYFIQLDNGRYTAQPTNHILFNDKSFCENVDWPKNLKAQTKYWSAEQ